MGNGKWGVRVRISHFACLRRSCNRASVVRPARSIGAMHPKMAAGGPPAAETTGYTDKTSPRFAPPPASGVGHAADETGAPGRFSFRGRRGMSPDAALARLRTERLREPGREARIPGRTRRVALTARDGLVHIFFLSHAEVVAGVLESGGACAVLGTSMILTGSTELTIDETTAVDAGSPVAGTCAVDRTATAVGERTTPVGRA